MDCKKLVGLWEILSATLVCADENTSYTSRCVIQCRALVCSMCGGIHYESRRDVFAHICADTIKRSNHLEDQGRRCNTARPSVLLEITWKGFGKPCDKLTPVFGTLKGHPSPSRRGHFPLNGNSAHANLTPLTSRVKNRLGKGSYRLAGGGITNGETAVLGCCSIGCTGGRLEAEMKMERIHAMNCNLSLLKILEDCERDYRTRRRPLSMSRNTRNMKTDMDGV